ncbi:MAG: hypothetical protein Q7S35_12305, partial [Candidatus Limnocylindrales bacterium]|nr:hypothetical protein [Candidatus Limnocylindrales bacterium]
VFEDVDVKSTLWRELDRLARAEAQVWAIVIDRLRERLHDQAHRATTAATLDEVADHRLDPYGAADRLLASLTSEAAP